jgi:flagellar L-ring protein FlgH
MAMTNMTLRNLTVLGLAMLAAACNSMPDRDPAYAGVRPPSTSPGAEPTGGLYRAGQGLALFADPRARNVGDILIVRLVENTNATKSASTTTKKENAVDIANPSLFGTSVVWDASSRLPFANTTGLDLSANLSSSQDFKGDAGSSQKNSLIGAISVTVVEVLANGNMLVRGEKQIGINQGYEFVRLAGVVRPQDVLPDNSVLSTQVADAQISYGGKGALADSNTHGWLSRFFLSGWWPF